MTAYPVDMTTKPDVQAFFDEATNTISYIVKDPSSSSCAIIDSVMDIDYAAGRITFEHADKLIKYIEEQGLSLEWIIETHVHADHLSAAPYIQQKLGERSALGPRLRSYKKCLAKCLTKAPSFSAMVHNLINCSKMGTFILLATCSVLQFQHQDTRLPAWFMSWGMPPLSEIRFSCRMGDRPVVISPVVALRSFMKAS